MSDININLSQCTCGIAGRALTYPPTSHHGHCASKPVLVPLSLDPWRSVTMTVRLGECDCADRSQAPHGPPAFLHSATCQARPVRVTCSISGKTWEESHLSAWETEDGIGLNTTVEAGLCDERWALVKALVTGQQPGQRWRQHIELFEQRDAVFAALAGMARAEETIQRAEEACAKHLPRANVPRIGPSPAASWLADYVVRLIEQVGVMS